MCIMMFTVSNTPILTKRSISAVIMLTQIECKNIAKEGHIAVTAVEIMDSFVVGFTRRILVAASNKVSTISSCPGDIPCRASFSAVSWRMRNEEFSAVVLKASVPVNLFEPLVLRSIAASLKGRCSTQLGNGGAIEDFLASALMISAKPLSLTKGFPMAGISVQLSFGACEREGDFDSDIVVDGHPTSSVTFESTSSPLLLCVSTSVLTRAPRRPTRPKNCSTPIFPMSTQSDQETESEVQASGGKHFRNEPVQPSSM